VNKKEDYKESLKPFGYSMRNGYLYSLYLYMGIIKAVCHLYNYAGVEFLKGYVAHFCYVRLKSFDTMLKVVEEHHDCVTANCILRMLADCVAVFRLIYMEPDKDIRMFRHCLYVIDGCKENLAVLPEELEAVDDSMPDIELQNIRNGIKFNRKHREDMIKDVNEILAHSPLKTKDEKAFNKIVEDRNWKFKEFKYTKQPRDNQYRMSDLYKMIMRFEDQDYFSFLSQYAHGLSMSNLVIHNHKLNSEGILIEGMALLETMIDYTLHFFNEEHFSIFTEFLQPGIQEKVFSCFDKEHRPEVNRWNAMIYSKLNSIAFGNSQN
jgi:hypothetical protein